MGYPTRIYYTEADKALIWDRWQKGESINAIGRHWGVVSVTVPLNQSMPECGVRSTCSP